MPAPLWGVGKSSNTHSRGQTDPSGIAPSAPATFAARAVKPVHFRRPRRPLLPSRGRRRYVKVCALSDMAPMSTSSDVKVFRGTLVHTPCYGQMDMLVDRVVVIVGVRVKRRMMLEQQENDVARAGNALKRLGVAHVGEGGHVGAVMVWNRQMNGSGCTFLQLRPRPQRHRRTCAPRDAPMPQAKIHAIVHGDQEAEVLGQHGLSPNDVNRLSDGQFLMPGMIDTHVHAPQ
eukprot:365738-Chlamydomonas_euryale.AAC.22